MFFWVHISALITTEIMWHVRRCRPPFFLCINWPGRCPSRDGALSHSVSDRAPGPPLPTSPNFQNLPDNGRQGLGWPGRLGTYYSSKFEMLDAGTFDVGEGFPWRSSKTPQVWRDNEVAGRCLVWARSRMYTLNSVVSHLWQPKCTWYYGVCSVHMDVGSRHVWCGEGFPCRGLKTPQVWRDNEVVGRRLVWARSHMHTLNSVVSHLWQSRCTLYYGVL
jgi:hypothetical protein